MIVLVGIGFFAGCILGALLQRAYPIGRIVASIGIPKASQFVRENESGGVPRVPREWDVPVGDRGRLALFVLVGQSNMSGRGSVSSPNTPKPHASIYSFNKDYRWYPAREPLGTVSNEVDWVATDGGTGVGPGLAFAKQLLQDEPTTKIRLIPCARGASTIEDWQPGLSQNSLYGACLKRARAASTYGRLAAVLFSQGESDADDPNLYPGRILSAESWSRKFESVVTNLRTDLDQPDLPVLFAQLGNYGGETPLPYWNEVKQQQAVVDLPGVIMIRTDDLELQPDGHFSTESNVEIGRRFATAYRNLAFNQQHTLGRPHDSAN